MVFNKKSISINGSGLMGCSAYFGMLIQAKYFSNLQWENMLQTSWIKSTYRVLIIILLIAPFGSIYLLVPATASMPIMIIFKSAVPVLLIFTTVFGFANCLFVKAKLVNDENSGTLPIEKGKHQ